MDVRAESSTTGAKRRRAATLSRSSSVASSSAASSTTGVRKRARRAAKVLGAGVTASSKGKTVSKARSPYTARSSTSTPRARRIRQAILDDPFALSPASTKPKKSAKRKATSRKSPRANPASRFANESESESETDSNSEMDDLEDQDYPAADADADSTPKPDRATRATHRGANRPASPSLPDILPNLPAGPYLSDDDWVGDVEPLRSPPAHLKRRRVFVDFLESSDDESAPGGKGNAKAGPSRAGAGTKPASPEAGPSRKRASTVAAAFARFRDVIDVDADDDGMDVEVDRAQPATHTGHGDANVGSKTKSIVRSNSRVRDANKPEPVGVLEDVFVPDEHDVVETTFLPAAPQRHPAALEALRDAPPSLPATVHAAGPSIQEPVVPRAETADEQLSRVLDILPDICPVWVKAQLGTRSTGDPVSNVLSGALEGGYPKAEKSAGGSGNAKSAPEPGAEQQYMSPLYRATERSAFEYVAMAQSALEGYFPLIPTSFIRSRLKENHSFLVPTYYALMADSAAEVKEFAQLKKGRKGKARAVHFGDTQVDAIVDVFSPAWAVGGGGGAASGVASGSAAGLGDAAAMPGGLVMPGVRELQLEHQWLEARILQERIDQENKAVKEAAHALALAEGGGIECGCCFTEEVWEELVQCEEGHLFCRDCVKQHAELKLGEQIYKITCMDQSVCPAPFPLSQLSSILQPKSLELFHRLKQAAELADAAIEGLESCPECPYAVVFVHGDTERLLRCENPECGRVSCRTCRKPEHLPKTCEEAEADRGLDKRHTIEDAMSEALIRKCPNAQCAQPFIKSDGCNKMTCTKCRTLSCYVCRQIIKDYSHFDQAPMDPSNPRKSTKCILWDNGGVGDATAIAAARDRAQAEVQAQLAAEGVDVADNMLNVDLPAGPAVPGAAAAAAAAQAYVGAVGGRFNGNAEALAAMPDEELVRLHGMLGGADVRAQALAQALIRGRAMHPVGQHWAQALAPARELAPRRRQPARVLPRNPRAGGRNAGNDEDNDDDDEAAAADARRVEHNANAWRLAAEREGEQGRVRERARERIRAEVLREERVAQRQALVAERMRAFEQERAANRAARAARRDA